MTFQADANEEAEMIIRAIMQASQSFLSISWEFFIRFKLQNKFATIFQISFNSKTSFHLFANTLTSCWQEEVDKSIYSKMADDLETANKRIKKKKSKKIGQNPSAISA